MVEVRSVVAIGTAVATFAIGAVVATSLSGGHDADSGLAYSGPTTSLPSIGDYANAWHVQTAIASYESRLLRFAKNDRAFTGARFAFRSRSFILYGAGPPPPTVRRLLADPPLNVDVRWVRVPYSRADLDGAVRLLSNLMPRGSVVDYAPNFGGVLVGLRPLPSSPNKVAVLYRRAQRATDVPVTFLEAGAADPM